MTRWLDLGICSIRVHLITTTRVIYRATELLSLRRSTSFLEHVKPTEEMERVLEKLGPWHIPVFLLALLGSLPYGLFVLSLSFMAPKVNYWCKSPKGINYSEWMQMNAGVDLRCSVRVAVPQSNALHSNISQVESENCHEWEYDHSVHTKTLIEEVSTTGTRLPAIFSKKKDNS